MADGFYIISGWVALATLYSDGYEIKGLPIQSDMTHGRRWLRPGNTADIVYPAAFVDTPTGQRFAYGGLVFKWPLRNMSPKMVYFIQDEFFPGGGSFMTRAYSAKLTAQTFNRSTGEWEAYRTWAKFANVSQEAEPVAGGFDNLEIHFTAYQAVV
jgi:hypothetical protein